MKKNSCIRQQADIEQINRCKDTVSELNESFYYLANGLSLVGNSVRLKILYLLFEENFCHFSTFKKNERPKSNRN